MGRAGGGGLTRTRRFGSKGNSRSGETGGQHGRIGRFSADYAVFMVRRERRRGGGNLPDGIQEFAAHSRREQHWRRSGTQGEHSDHCLRAGRTKIHRAEWGPLFKFNESVSFVVRCDTQQEVDEYWEKLTAGGPSC